MSPTAPCQFWILRCTPYDITGGLQFTVGSVALATEGARWCFARRASTGTTSGASTNLCYGCLTGHGDAPSTKVSIQPILLLIFEDILYIELLFHNNHGESPLRSTILWCRIIYHLHFGQYNYIGT